MSEFDIQRFVRPGQEIVGRSEKVNPKHPLGAIDFVIHSLAGDKLLPDEDVLLEIRKRSDTCMLIGGKPLELKVLSGIGRLTVIELATGVRTNTYLQAGQEAIVTPDNSLYVYSNFGGFRHPLVMHDHSEKFDPANEPTLDDVVRAFSLAYAGSPLYEAIDS